MTTYHEAVRMILDCIRTTEAVECPLLDTLDMVAAEDIFSGVNLPQKDISGPDGYAVKSSDIATASREKPVVLKIIETVKAGTLPVKTVKSGSAARIMTGAFVPEGADCVIRFEDTDEPGNKSGPNLSFPKHVSIYSPAVPGDGIRTAGCNSRKGDPVITKGTVIGPGQIAALAAHGYSAVKVHRRPKIAVISTGSELVRAGERLKPGKTYDCNSVAIASLIQHYGGRAVITGIARDTIRSVGCKLGKALMADAIITSGGASKGDFDLVRLVLGRCGKQIFSTINMGPGASVAFGLIDNPSEKTKGLSIPLFLLAGPPTGCLVNFETLVRPALLKMMGYANTEHPEIEVEADAPFPDAKRMAFAKWGRIRKENGRLRISLDSSAGAFAAIASANALAVIPEGATFKAGDRIKVLPLDWRKGE